MLTFLEHTHFSGGKLDCRQLPLWYCEQNLGRINWSSAKKYLPLEFQKRFGPKVDSSKSTLVANGVSVDPGYRGNLTRQEFDEIMTQRSREDIFSNTNIPVEWFESYFSTFTNREWFSYLEQHSLTEQQFDLYGRRGNRYNYNTPLSRIPYEKEKFSLIFSHPQLTIEFIQAHLEDALDKAFLLIQTKAGYELALQHHLEFGNIHIEPLNAFVEPKDFDRYPHLINGKLFRRSDLPMWFTDKYRICIQDYFNSRPSEKLASWLREYRPMTQGPWESKNRDWSKFKFENGLFSQSLLDEKAFTVSMKKALSSFF